MHIVTERLIIREFVEDDWDQVLAYTADPVVMKYIPEGVFTEEKARQFVLLHQSKNAKNYAVTLREGQALIGHIVFHPWFGEHTYEIGWVFHPGYQRKGYATEAAASTLNYAFTNLGLHRVVATCQPDNIASYRVMEKIGMRREGHFIQCIPREDGTWWDEYYYAVLKSEWVLCSSRSSKDAK